MTVANFDPRSAYHIRLRLAVAMRNFFDGFGKALFALERGVTVITPNRRLSRRLLSLYGETQQRAGLEVWETPDSLPWGAWLERAWEGACEATECREILLSPVQERRLWRQVIDPEMNGAGRALEAWRLVHAWQLAMTGREWEATDETQAFCRWASRYSARCREQGWTDRARLSAELAAFYRGRPQAVSGELLLYGFDSLNPAQQELVEALGGTGCRVELEKPEPVGESAARVCFPDTEAELTTIACWVRALLRRRAAARIGVVTPRLKTVRGQVERIFEDVLQPQRLLPGVEQARLFKLSHACSLAESPLVHSALIALECNAEIPSCKTVGAFLRSPHFAGGQSETSQRAALDAQLRERGALTLPLFVLASKAQGCCPILADRLARLLDERLPATQARHGWAASFERWLAILGFPGERPLNHNEFQALEAWRELLASFAALDLVAPRTRFESALGELRELARESAFEPEAWQTGVEIMEIGEAEAIRFDHLWVAGLDDEAWPRPPAPNAFLPLALQRKFALPRNSPERELAYAQEMTVKLVQSAPQVVLSHAAREQDRERRASPLLASYPEREPDALGIEAFTPYRALLWAGRVEERLADERAPALPQGFPAPGGAGLFASQAACPFRAFAEYRLAAKPLEEPCLGLNAAARGRLVHKTMELFWSGIESLATLCSLAEEALACRIEDAVEQALALEAQYRPQAFDRNFRRLERDRLVRLLHDWIAVEKQRAPYRIHAIEQQRALALGGLVFKLKIDRIDRLQDGRLFVLDYKTGDADVSRWFGPRPDEPQLPLYSLLDAEAVAALAFARLRAGETGFKGLAQSEGVAPGVAVFDRSQYAREIESWEAMGAQWRTNLAELAQDFRSGRAEVDPKRYPDTCRCCSLPALCRINDRTPDESGA